jgi:diacylglycerol kinase family enzyme
MTKYKIILNPTAGKGNGLKDKTEIEQNLKKIYLDFDIDLTGYPEHAIDLARKAAEDGYDVVVAAAVTAR